MTAAGDAALELAGICDDTDSAACLLPFPNDRFTVADPTTDTGRRVALSPLAMPRNVAGKPIDPTGRSDDRTTQRELTDEVMAEIQKLTGQEYVPRYAPKKA